MRIVLTSNYKIGNETGASAVTDLLANKLSKNNNILYICLGKKLKLSKQNKNLHLLTIPYITFRGIDLPIITPKTIFFTNEKLTNFNPQVIHNQNHVLISKITQAWAISNNIPNLVTFHHIPTQAIEHMFPEISKLKITKLVQKFYINTTLKSFLKNTDAVISLNKKQYIEISKINKKIKNFIVNNGIDLTDFINIKRKSLNKIIKFIFLGSYNKRKNQMFLVKTFKHLEGKCQLSLYGNFSSGQEYLSKIKDYIHNNKISNVKINNYVNKPDVKKVYSDADYFITASTKEVQSLAIIEALASGLPVIGIENETTSELIDSSNGLRVKGNITAKSFSQKIIDFTKNNNYLKLSLSARRISKNFDINKTVLQLQKVYKSISQSQS